VIPSVAASVLDPTGAGDTFCGVTLAYLLQKKHPIMAARQAVPLAAEMITQVGPTALLSEDPPPEAPLDARVQVNEGQVRVVAEQIFTLSDTVSICRSGTSSYRTPQGAGLFLRGHAAAVQFLV
jgi:hypothetical protein